VTTAGYHNDFNKSYLNIYSIHPLLFIATCLLAIAHTIILIVSEEKQLIAPGSGKKSRATFLEGNPAILISSPGYPFKTRSFPSLPPDRFGFIYFFTYNKHTIIHE